MVQVRPSGQACGAEVIGVDFSREVDATTIAEIRAIWLEHHVLAFPDQQLSDDDLVRFTRYFGSVGDDPFFAPMDSNEHVVALTRRADEQAPVFAETWHSDWSFKSDPPIGTCLYSLIVPPVGGNTSFANQQLALAEMPPDLRGRIEGKVALHSAAGAYAPDGFYGDQPSEADRSMRIVTNDSAREVYPHPFIVEHPESGRETLFSTMGYIIGVQGMDSAPAQALIQELHQWQTREAFRYEHQWQPQMLVLWDNRSVLHKANGGYDGYARELHRTTIAGAPGTYVS
ncbi:MAG: TauD/TfdA family dioxygenase [Pseudomonadales bacterium]